MELYFIFLFNLRQAHVENSISQPAQAYQYAWGSPRQAQVPLPFPFISWILISCYYDHMLHASCFYLKTNFNGNAVVNVTELPTYIQTHVRG